MSTADRSALLPNRATDDRGRLIPLTPEQIRERNAEAIRALDDVAQMGDAAEQRETLALLMRVLGPERTISTRNLFP